MRRTPPPIAIAIAVAIRRGSHVRVDDEGSLDVDLDTAGPDDGAVDFLERRHRARVGGHDVSWGFAGVGMHGNVIVLAAGCVMKIRGSGSEFE